MVEITPEEQNCYVVKIRLDTEEWQERLLDRKFEACRLFYNKLIKRIKMNQESLAAAEWYRSAKSLYLYYKNMDKEINIKKGEKKDNKYRDEMKEVLKLLKQWQEEYNLYASAFTISKEATVLKNSGTFKDKIPSNVAGFLATNAAKALEKVLYGNGKELHYKKFGTCNYITGLHKNVDIRFDKETGTVSVYNAHISSNQKKKHLIRQRKIYENTHTKKSFEEWYKPLKSTPLKIPILETDNYPDAYIKEAVQQDIRYCGIAREVVKNGYIYQLVLTVRGKTPQSRRKDGSFKYMEPVRRNTVGIDIGLSSIAVSGQDSVELVKIGGDEVARIDYKIACIQRHLDRSQREVNPDCYNADGTYIKGKKLTNFSNSYKKSRHQIKYLKHSRSITLKNWQRKFANELIQKYGLEIRIEKIDFAEMAKRLKETERQEHESRVKDSRGNKKYVHKYKRKKQFGNLIENYAPAQLVSLINARLKKFGTELQYIDTSKVKASQYNHITDTYEEKTLSQRWNRFDNGIRIQRDLYSAFIIQHTTDDLAGIDRNACLEDFDDFKAMHDKCIDKIKNIGIKSSSFGIR